MTRAALATRAVASPTSRVAIVIRNLTVRFDSGDGMVTALKSVSVDIAEGSLVTRFGPSGCGKSTLLRAIADLVPKTGLGRPLTKEG